MRCAKKSLVCEEKRENFEVCEDVTALPGVPVQEAGKHAGGRQAWWRRQVRAATER